MPDKVIAITMGDPAGIGPEVIAAAWPDLMSRGVRCFVIGDPAVMQRATRLRSSSIEVRIIGDSGMTQVDPGRMDCLAIDCPGADQVVPGVIDARAGQAAYEAVVTACRLAREGKADAIVTAPLHKKALHLAGHTVPGHTELLAECCGVERSAMLLYLPPGAPLKGELGLGVVHATLHMSVRQAVESLTSATIEYVTDLISQFTNKLARAFAGGREARIAVAALNPHAGELGLFGREEIEIIAPAVKNIQRRWPSVAGPLPCDTLMARAASGEFDGVVAMYHDQGHIALKLLGMHRAINVTLGLPIIRTSVAHGTAMDIAWQGKADPQSLLAAVDMAALLAADPSAPSSSPAG